MSITKYNNIESGISLGSIKSILFQDIRNVIKIGKPISHSINSIAVDTTSDSEGLQSIQDSSTFETSNDSWTLQNCTRLDGKVTPNAILPTDTYISKDFTCFYNQNYELKLFISDKNGNINGIKVEVIGNSTGELLNTTFTAGFQQIKKLLFSTNSNTQVSIKITYLAESLLEVFYIEQIDLSNLINFFTAPIISEPNAFEENSTNNKNLFEQRASAFIPGNSIQLDRLFSKMTKNRFIAIVEDNNGNLRLLGSLSNGCSFKYKFSTNAEIGKPAGYSIEFSGELSHSAYHYTGIKSCFQEHINNNESFPWLRATAFDNNHVTEYWESFADNYIQKY